MAKQERKPGESDSVLRKLKKGKFEGTLQTLKNRILKNLQIVVRKNVKLLRDAHAFNRPISFN